MYEGGWEGVCEGVNQSGENVPERFCTRCSGVRFCLL